MFAKLENHQLSFSKENPGVHLLGPYDRLYKKLSVKQYDRVMTAIYLAYDPKSVGGKSNRSEEELRKDIAVNFLNEPDFDWNEFKDYINAYKQDSKTKLQIELYYLEQEILERRSYINQLTWESNATLKDKMLLNHDKYLEKYMELKQRVDEESDISTHGNQNLSRTERRGLQSNGKKG